MNFTNTPPIKNKNNSTTIIVNSCDQYEDVQEMFFLALNDYWNDCPFPVVVNTESSALLNYNESQIRNKAWGQRLIDILNKIDTDYVLMLFDDFILESKVCNAKVLKCLRVLNDNPESSVFYLNYACKAHHPDEPELKYRKLKDYVSFRVNSVPALWRKSDLVELTSKLDSAWSWEMFGSYRSFGNGKDFYSISSSTNNIIDYDADKGGAIYRGKWVKSVVEHKLVKYNLDIDLNKRGVVNPDDKVKRSLSWKIRFLYVGLRSTRLRFLYFVVDYFKSKVLKW